MYVPCLDAAAHTCPWLRFRTPAGASLLALPQLRPSRAAHGRQLALLAGGFASLRLQPPQLLASLCELFKRQRHVLKLLGPHEALLLLWALARLAHADAPVQLLLTQQAATQVGRVWRPPAVFACVCALLRA